MQNLWQNITNKPSAPGNVSIKLQIPCLAAPLLLPCRQPGERSPEDSALASTVTRAWVAHSQPLPRLGAAGAATSAAQPNFLRAQRQMLGKRARMVGPGVMGAALLFALLGSWVGQEGAAAPTVPQDSLEAGL